MIKNIEIARKTYALRFDHNAMADLEEKAGMGIKELFAKQMEFSGVRLMLWAGLKWKNPGLTLQAAGTLVQQFITDESGPPKSIDDLYIICIEAMQQSGVIRKVKVDDPDTGGEADPSTAGDPNPTPPVH